MKVVDINPHVRFAEQITYSTKHRTVFVRDFRLIYIIGGKGELIINGVSHQLTANTLFYCPGATTYTIEPQNPLNLYVLNFDLTQNFSHITTSLSMKFDSTKTQESLEPVTIDDSNVLNSYLVLKTPLEFKHLIKDIIDEFASQEMFFRENCSSMLKSILIRLHRMNVDIPGTSSDTINALITYINNNFKREIKNGELAEIAKYHEYYLNRLFIRRMGISMHRYILLLRLNESKRLLLNTNLSISTIASQIGFNSTTHFSTYFKKEIGLSPFKYRSSFKNNV